MVSRFPLALSGPRELGRSSGVLPEGRSDQAQLIDEQSVNPVLPSRPGCPALQIFRGPANACGATLATRPAEWRLRVNHVRVGVGTNIATGGAEYVNRRG